jgi:hypothetical protein
MGELELWAIRELKALLRMLEAGDAVVTDVAVGTEGFDRNSFIIRTGNKTVAVSWTPQKGTDVSEG